MVISSSRRTDIPAFYSDWLINRIRAGVVKTRNPFNSAQVQEISLRPEDVNCIVFWTKDPAPMLPKLQILDEMGYHYYFQFTLTPYGRELEQNLRPKPEIVETFRSLSRKIGSHQVIWRYDPIILNRDWSVDCHITAYEELCKRLSPYTERVIISFVDLYKKVYTDRMREITPLEMVTLAKEFAGIAADNGLSIYSCCEALDLSVYSIGKSACIDKELIQRITGMPVEAKPDRNQRPNCGCCKSVDIGAYNTCGNGCVYCYANHSPASTARNRERHNPDSAFLME